MFIKIRRVGRLREFQWQFSVFLFAFTLSQLSGKVWSDIGKNRGNSDLSYDYEFVNNKRSFDYRPRNPAAGIGKGCPHQFGSRCTCDYRVVDSKYDLGPNPSFVVQCSSSGFTNTSMLEYLPIETEVLVFTGNKVASLRSNIFGNLGRTPNLRVIDMSANGITEIDGKAFHRVESVEILILAHNELSNSSLHRHPRMFSNFFSLRELHLTNAFINDIWSFEDLEKIFAESNLTKLEKLHLGMNELAVISNPAAFCTLPALRHLYIPQNQLTDDVFLNISCLPNLEIIDLRQNQIRTITPESRLWKLFKRVNAKGEDIRIELLWNPFHCDCRLQTFIDWLKHEILENPDRMRDVEDLKCETGYPTNNTHLFLRKIELTECEPLIASSAASNVVTGIVWILSLLFVGLILTVAYVYRIHILRRVSPIIHAAATGVHYTSIDKNETVEIAHV